jgi:hypothetical protein
MFHLPVPVKMPISNLDCEAILHPKKSMSSIKYFKFRPYFIGVLWKSCGKSCGKIVDKHVENPASFLASRIKILLTFLDFGKKLRKMIEKKFSNRKKYFQFGQIRQLFDSKS